LRAADLAAGWAVEDQRDGAAAGEPGFGEGSGQRSEGVAAGGVGGGIC